jgi:hypothetical protein
MVLFNKKRNGMKIKDKILSETSEEVKQRVRDTANKLVMKTETLEEATNNYVNYCAANISEDEDLADADKRGFIYGAKWQQEQIGKSEFLQRLRGTLSDAEARRLIFETFKKI